MYRTNPFLSLPFFVAVLLIPVAGSAQELPDYLKDRGPGIPTSMFGTYITKHQSMIYPFYEYYTDHDLEYSPNELGFNLDEDFRGKYRANEYLIFLGYGIADWLAVEFEAALYINATLETDPNDPTGVPSKD